tara:strand:- start:180 stop:1028 length:849 start_codon:yes stop_codon:yes gene_type:complete
MKKTLKKLVKFLFNKKLKKIHKLKDLEKGKTCYIIGDGFSLRSYDLKFFKKYDSISLSFLPFHKEFDYINCKYCLLIQPYFFYGPTWSAASTNPPKKHFWNNKIGKYFKEKIINRYKDKIFITHLSNYFLLKNNKNNYFILNKFNDEGFDEFLKVKNLNPWEGSLKAGILFAIYLGYKKIYLVGCDYADNPITVGHWYEKSIEKQLSENESLKQFDENLKHFFDSLNDIIDIKIITSHNNQNDKRFVSYEKHSGLSLKNNERNQLIGEETLSILKCYAGYYL